MSAVRKFCLLALWAALLQAIPTAGQGNTFNMVFDYGFFDNKVPTANATAPQVSALVCETEYWLSGVLQNYTGNPSYTFQATAINWQRGKDQLNGTVGAYTVSFSGIINSADGSPLPSPLEITHAYSQPVNPALNKTTITEYIKQYVYHASPVGNSTNYWQDVDSATFNGTFGAPVNANSAMLPGANCPSTAAPTSAPTNFTPGLNFNATGPVAGTGKF